MPRTLVIPDVHLNCTAVDKILANLTDHYDQVVFLGDFFDDFGDTVDDALRAAKWLAHSIEQPNRLHLVGNHDLSYLSPSSFTRCAGWTPEKMRAMAPVLNLLPRERFRVAAEIDGWLLSHAGFAPAFASDRTAAELVESSDWQLRTLFAGGRPSIFGAGHGRGGKEPVGGVTWCDWDTEFAPTPGIHQIVGHSPSRHVRIATIDAAGSGRRSALPLSDTRSTMALSRHESVSLNLCLDTGLSYTASIVGDTVTLIPIAP